VSWIEDLFAKKIVFQLRRGETPALLHDDLAAPATDRSSSRLPGFRKSRAGGHDISGFTLLEIMVCLTLLAVGVVLTLSLISGSLGNIRKVQLRTRTVEHAEAVMELVLLDESIHQPTVLTGDFEDGTRWSVHVENYASSNQAQLQSRPLPPSFPVKMLSYTVEMFNPDSRGPDYRLQTLKLVKTTPEDQLTRIQ
jgi:prepilin-type N-terminal cleavage/methylation domain-containing protein